MASKKQPEQAPVQPIENKKEKKKMKKFSWETLKTITIAVLITGIVAFIYGMKYQENQTALVHSEATAIANSTKTSAQPVKQ